MTSPARAIGLDGRSWALVGGVVIDPATGSVERGGLVMDGGTIAAVGPDVRAETVGDTPVVDLAGRFLLPGLIDTHIHLAFDGGPRPIERYIDEGAGMGLGSRIDAAAASALLSGATTIRDLGGPNSEVFGLRRRIADGLVPGPRLVASGLVLSPPTGHLHFIARTTDGHGLGAATQAQMDSGADCIKVMVTGGVHTPGSDPADVYYEVDDLRAAAGMAHGGGRRITAHAGNLEGIERAILGGFDSIQHGSALDERLAGLAAERGITLVPTLGTHATMADHLADARIPSYVATKASRGIAAKVRAFEAAVAAGVTIAAGTDGGVTFVSHAALAMELALFREHGLGPMETLASATSIAAVEVGLADRIGRLSVGFEADLVVLDADPLVDIHALDRPAMVISHGAIASDTARRFPAAGGVAR